MIRDSAALLHSNSAWSGAGKKHAVPAPGVVPHPTARDYLLVAGGSFATGGLIGGSDFAACRVLVVGAGGLELHRLSAGLDVLGELLEVVTERHCVGEAGVRPRKARMQTGIRISFGDSCGPWAPWSSCGSTAPWAASTSKSRGSWASPRARSWRPRARGRARCRHRESRRCARRGPRGTRPRPHREVHRRT